MAELKWPRGAIVACTCGKEYPATAIESHRRMSRNPVCTGPPHVARIEQPRFAKKLDPADPADRAKLSNGRPPRPGLTVVEPDPVVEVNGERAAPAPTMVTAASFRLPARVWTYYDYVKANPHFDFDGSMAELIAEVFDQFFALFASHVPPEFLLSNHDQAEAS